MFTLQIQRSSNSLNNYFVEFINRSKRFPFKIKSKFNTSEILNTIKRIKDKKVLILGEAIIDRYTFVDVMNISTKSPTLSTKYLFHEDYYGGSLAISRNLQSLGCETNVFYPSGNSTEEKKFNLTLKKDKKFKNKIFSFICQRLECAN